VSKHQLTELPTGARVISERVPAVRSVALGLWIGAGSRDEAETRAGVSHFIEHLLFKGSSRYSAQEIAEIFDELGGELNAATSSSLRSAVPFVSIAPTVNANGLFAGDAIAPYTDFPSVVFP